VFEIETAVLTAEPKTHNFTLTNYDTAVLLTNGWNMTKRFTERAYQRKYQQERSY
jgi:hypothetical protein